MKNNNKLNSAYSALTMKDLMQSFSGVAIKFAIICMAFAMAVVQTDMFLNALAVTATAAMVSMLASFAAFLCGIRMKRLGFTEIELERMNLA